MILESKPLHGRYDRGLQLLRLNMLYLERVFVDVESVSVLLFGEDQALVQEEDVPASSRPTVSLVDSKVILGWGGMGMKEWRHRK